MANVCPGTIPAANEPVTTTGITVTPGVPQPAYSTNASDPFPFVAWTPTDEFCTFQFTATPGNELIVPSTQWNVSWKNPDLTNGADIGGNPALAAGFGVVPLSGTPITGPATSGPIAIGSNTLTVTIVSGTIRVSMPNGSLLGYEPGDPVSNAVIKYEWKKPVHNLQHAYFDSGVDQTPTGITNYQTSTAVPNPGPPVFSACSLTQWSRNSMAFNFNIDTNSPAWDNNDLNTVEGDYSTDGGGTWFPLDNTNNDFLPLGDVLVPSSFGLFVIAGNQFNAGDSVSFRVRWLVNGVTQTSETIVCGPVVTFSYPTIDCAAPPVTDTSATFSIQPNNGPAGEYNASAASGPVGVNQDVVNVVWGTTPGGPYPNTTPMAVSQINATGVIGGLTPSTQYYYRIQASETFQSAGQFLDQGECTFTTLAASAPTATCAPANSTTDVSTNLNGSFTNADPGDPSLWDFKYGTNPGGPYPLSSGQVVVVNANDTVNVFVGGLTPGTQYYYTLVLYQSDGTTVIATSSECTFTTIGPTCGAATAITTNSATLNGTTLGVPAGGYKYQFRYGTINGGPYTTVIGPFPAATGGPTPVAQPTGAVLAPATPYFFVVDILDPGNVVVATSAPNCPFVTATPAPVRTAACSNGTNVDSNSADLNGSLGNIQPGDQYRYRYGTTFGGPYPSTLGPFPAANGAVVNNTGNVLLAGTVYFFIVEALDSLNVVQATSLECNFITQASESVNCTGASGITTTSANLNGQVFSSEPGDTAEFVWGTTPGGPYPNTACAGTPLPYPANPDNVGPCPIAGLTPATNYYFRILVRDSLNVLKLTSGECTFQTAANPPPVISTDPPTAITSTCITFNGGGLFVPAGCTYAFEYGTTPGGPYPFTTNDGLSTGASPENFSAQQCGLAPGTQYYYRALINCGGNKTFGPEVPAFTTNIIVDPCEAPTAVTPVSATLHATAENVPAGYSYEFHYGTTPGGPYPFNVSGGPSSGGTPDPYQANIVGLTPGTTYYYTSVVLNPAQQVVAGGGECAFTTAGAIGPGGFVYWCGQLYDSAQCVFVPGVDGPGYWDCNQV